MLVRIPAVLTKDQVAHFRRTLEGLPWVDGKVTAGAQSARAKSNLQVPEETPEARELGQTILTALGKNEAFISAALPMRVFPPLFNRYDEGMFFKAHVDNAVRFAPGMIRQRTDVSCTLFLSEPDEYDGGELMVDDTFGSQRIKLPAGDLVLYPGTSVHRVEPVTRGHRVASFFWIESMVRSDDARRLLFEMDTHLMRLRTSVGETDPAVIGLTGTYHNLLRMWADV